MKILIIGAGWYGCHLSSKLIDRGYNVTLVDKSNDIFTGSSYKNQNRLHLGFHYPRSEATIKECLKGFTKFIIDYEHLTSTFNNNLYFISSINSYTDIDKYIETIKNHSIEFNFFEGKLPIKLKNVESKVLQVNEKYINPFKAKEYFKLKLLPFFKVIDDKTSFESINNITNTINIPFDLIINCTFNMLNPIEYDSYELFVSLIYEIKSTETFAYTIMDGPFFSIYPYDIEKQLYTVTSVKYGVAYKGTSSNFELSNDKLFEIRDNMEKQLLEYIPNWNSVAVYNSFFSSWKTKHNYLVDDRSLKFSYENGILNFYGGKITGIFEADDILFNILKI